MRSLFAVFLIVATVSSVVISEPANAACRTSKAKCAMTLAKLKKQMAAAETSAAHSDAAAKASREHAQGVKDAAARFLCLQSGTC